MNNMEPLWKRKNGIHKMLLVKAIFFLNGLYEINPAEILAPEV